MQYDSWFITGATSGIGEAFARRAPDRVRLVLSGQNQQRMTSLLDNLRGDIHAVTGDLTNPLIRFEAIKAAQYAAVDLLILNAGIGHVGPFLSCPSERLIEMMDLNMITPLAMAHALLPGMIERAKQKKKRAGVIFVSSLAGFMPIPYFSTYAASKSFLLHFSKALSHELQFEPVDCLVLCPGTTDTRFFQRAHATKMPRKFWSASPRRVAREGMLHLGRKNVHIVGVTNRMVRRFTKLLPMRWASQMAAICMKRRLG